MPSDIPPPINEPLNTFFAVGLKRGEHTQVLAGEILKTAKAEGILFRRLEVLDTIEVGTIVYARIRSDLLNPFPLLDKLYAGGRSVISSMVGGEYVVRFQGGRIGKISNLLMHAAAKLGQSRMYRGTKIKHWERQFAAA